MVRRTLVLLLLLLGSSLASADERELRAHFIALNTHGESILIQTPGGKNVLIDAGLPHAAPTVIDYLRAQGVDSIDLLVLTHDDPDHVGGMYAVARAFPIERYWESPLRASSALHDLLLGQLKRDEVSRVAVMRGSRLEIEEGVSLDVLAPWRPWIKTPLRRPRADNPNSVVIRLTCGATRLLLTGDMTAATEERFLEAGVDSACHLLKVGHHGSTTSSTPRFLASTGAEVAVICCEPNSPLGLPRVRVLENLERAGMTWYRTDANGTVVVRTRGAGDLTVSVARGGANAPEQNQIDVLGMVMKYSTLSAEQVPPDRFVGMTGRKLYHRAYCFAGRLIQREQAVAYASTAAAEADGRAPCSACRPK